VAFGKNQKFHDVARTSIQSAVFIGVNRDYVDLHVRLGFTLKKKKNFFIYNETVGYIRCVVHYTDSSIQKILPLEQSPRKPPGIGI
jgi:hypothetical protein